MSPQHRFLLLVILVGALSVADFAGVDSRVSLIAYGVVLLSLLVQGGLVAPVTRALRIEKTD